jgi:hypothetical protein
LRTLRTEIEIAASSADVWAALTDFASFPEWNPFILNADAAPAQGARLTVTLKPEGGSTMKFRPQIIAMEPGRELRWKGHVGIRGLLDAEHRFAIEEKADGSGVRFIHEEHFSGILLPLLWGKMEAGTRGGFEAMNRALKSRVEAAALASAKN